MKTRHAITIAGVARWPQVSRALIGFVFLVFGTHVPAAFASPYFTLDTPADFQAALDDGRIAPVTSWNPDFEFLYPGLEDDFRILDLSVSAEGLNLEFPGLTDDDSLFIGAFRYTYPEDPDLSKGRLKHTMTFDPPLSKEGNLSIHLRDEESRTKVWQIPVPRGTVRKEIDVPADQPFGGDVKRIMNGFDLKHVLSIDYDIQLRKGGTYVGKMTVMPEPSALSLLALGGLVALRRRRVQRA